LIETSVIGKRFGCAYLFSIVREGYNMKLAVIALVITVALSNTAALAQPGDQMPTFNIHRNCSSEAAEGVDIQSTMTECVQDEVNAKKQLDQEWSKWGSNLKRECVEESAMGGDQSYVELITCLEMSSSQWNGDQTVGQAPLKRPASLRVALPHDSADRAGREAARDWGDLVAHREPHAFA
jgi:hypothetical protein